MAVLTGREIIQALERLGELAAQRGEHIELLLMGGAVMVLVYDARLSTRDVDAVVLLPPEVRVVRDLVKQVAHERDLPDDWMNDGAKGYLVGFSEGPVILSAPGIDAKIPALPQLLAMKLSAWRDDVDIEDARRILRDLEGEQHQVWKAVEPYLVPGDELKAQFAFSDLWESTHGSD